MPINVCRIISVQVIHGLSIVHACCLPELLQTWVAGCGLGVICTADGDTRYLGTWVGSLGSVVLPPHKESPMEHTSRAKGAP